MPAPVNDVSLDPRPLPWPWSMYKYIIHDCKGGHGWVHQRQIQPNIAGLGLECTK